MTEASLVLKVDSTDVSRGAKSLDDLAAAGGKAEKSVTQLSASWAKTGAAIGLAAVAAGGAFVQMTRNAINAADAMNDMHLKTGLAFKNLAAYDLLARQSGTSLEGVAQGFKFLNSYMVEHSAKLKTIGVDSKDSTVAMGQFADAIVGIQDPALKTKLAMEVLGRSGMDLIPMLSGGSVAFEQARKQTEAYASALEKVAPKADQFNDGIARMEIGAKVVGLTLADKMLPTLLAVSDALLESSVNGGLMETWGASGAAVLKTFAVAALNVAYVLTQIGDSIGGTAAKFAAILSGDFAQVGVINGLMLEKSKAAREEVDRMTASIWNASPAAVSAAAEQAKVNKGLEDAARKMVVAKQAADAHKKSIDDFISSLEKESVTYGMTAAQVKIYEAAQLGMTKTKLEHAIAIIEETAAMETAAEAAKDAQKVREQAEKDALRAAQDARKAEAQASKDMWDSIDRTAHDTFVSVANGNKDMWSRMKESAKNMFFDWLYSMTAKKWLVNVSAGFTGAVASGTAAAGGMGGGSGIGGLLQTGQTIWSGFSGGMASSMGSLAMSAGEMFGSAALTEFGVGATYAGAGGTIAGAAAGSTAAGIGATVATAMPYIAAAMAVYSIGKSLFGGSGGTPTSNTGNAAMQFDAQGNRTGMQTYYGGSSAGTDAVINNMQTSYMKAAMALGIGTVATSFSFGGNTGKNGQSPNFALGGGSFYQAETTSSDAAIQLAASRAVFSALQGSDLPTYLARMFDGLTAGAMTQADIDNTLAFAGSVKQMREALLETRAPLEILRANVNAGTAAFATSAATFRNDFVAAIDAGINPATFAQWQQLGAAIDQLAAADAQLAADNLAKVNDQIKSLQDVALSNFDAARKATDSLRAFALSVRDLQRALWAGSQSPLSSTYGVTRSQFSATNALAGQGDINAQGALSGAATAFLDAAKLNSTSAIEYAREFAFVQNALSDTALLTEDAVTVADQQLTQLQQANAWLAAIAASNQTQSLGSAVQAAQTSAGAVNAATGADQVMRAAQAEQAAQAIQDAAASAARIAAKEAALQRANAAYSRIVSGVSAEEYARTTSDYYAARYEYNNLPAFAVGTNEVPFDMTARIHKGEEIKPAAYVEQDKADRKETNDLLREMKKELMLIKGTNYRMWQLEDKHDIEGMPEVRAA